MAKKGRIFRFIEKKVNASKLTDKQKRSFLFTADVLLNLIVIVFLVFVIRTYIISPFQVFGVSMCNTLNYSNGRCVDTYGDYIIINKSSYLRIFGFEAGNPKRGDVIVFKPPQNNGQFYIKRVIGVPGDTVKLVDGYVEISNAENPDGIQLDEPYLSSENLGSTFATGDLDEFVVPEGKYFVLGDNRQQSSDSRICFKDSPGAPGCENPDITPFIGLENIEGKAALVLWPSPRVVITHDYQNIN